MARRSLAWPVIAAMIAVACGRPPSLSSDAWTALRDAKEFEIVSLDPQSPESQGPGMLYYWKVLGRTKVASLTARNGLTDALEKSTAEKPVGASCFMPRHAIVVTHEGHTYEILICFSCGYIWWYVDGKGQKSVLIGGSQHTVFDQVFEQAGLPVAP